MNSVAEIQERFPHAGRHTLVRSSKTRVNGRSENTTMRATHLASAHPRCQWPLPASRNASLEV